MLFRNTPQHALDFTFIFSQYNSSLYPSVFAFGFSCLDFDCKSCKWIRKKKMLLHKLLLYSRNVRDMENNSLYLIWLYTMTVLPSNTFIRYLLFRSHLSWVDWKEWFLKVMWAIKPNHRMCVFDGYILTLSFFLI